MRRVATLCRFFDRKPPPAPGQAISLGAFFLIWEDESFGLMLCWSQKTVGPDDAIMALTLAWLPRVGQGQGASSGPALALARGALARCSAGPVPRPETDTELGHIPTKPSHGPKPQARLPLARV